MHKVYFHIQCQRLASHPRIFVLRQDSMSLEMRATFIDFRLLRRAARLNYTFKLQLLSPIPKCTLSVLSRALTLSTGG